MEQREMKVDFEFSFVVERRRDGWYAMRFVNEHGMTVPPLPLTIEDVGRIHEELDNFVDVEGSQENRQK